jgi:hypothetical protein
LNAGVVAGPVFLTAGLVQAATREGFDLGRHALSQLALGSLGFVQIAAFLLTGTLLVAASVGARRAMTGAGATWGPRLVAGFGVGMLVAGVFVADPAFGYPVGTAAGPGQVSWHGALHGVGFAVAMISWVSACLVLTSVARVYDALATLTPSPMVLLNRAVAHGRADGPEAGLRLVDELDRAPGPSEHHLLPSVRGDLLTRLGRRAEARAEFVRAAALAGNARERDFLLGRARGC